MNRNWSISLPTEPVDPHSKLYRMAYWWKKYQPTEVYDCNLAVRLLISLIITPVAFLICFFICKRPAIFEDDPLFFDSSRGIYVSGEEKRWHVVEYEKWPRIKGYLIWPVSVLGIALCVGLMSFAIKLGGLNVLSQAANFFVLIVICVVIVVIMLGIVALIAMSWESGYLYQARIQVRVLRGKVCTRRRVNW